MKRPIRLAAPAAVTGILVSFACGGSGRNPVAPAAPNQAPVVSRVELVGYSTVGLSASAGIRADVRDPDGDPVTCRWTAGNGRVLVDSANSCAGVYFAPTSGATDHVDVTPVDSRGAAGSPGNLVVPLGAESIAIGAASPQPPSPEPSPNPHATPTPEPTPGPTPTPAPAPTPQPTPTPGPSNAPPTVTVTSAAGSCQAPCAIEVTANGSDPDHDTLTYGWSGCASGSGVTATCTVAAAGNYTATVSVSDGRGGSATASRTLTGTSAPPPPNRPPTVTATSGAASCHPRPAMPCTIAVQAQASDPDGDALTYAWQGCASGTGSTATCTISGVGGTTASVIVTDPKGASASASVSVSGTNASPTVSVTGGGSCHPRPGTPCSLSAAASATDSDGDPLVYTWSGCASGSGTSVSCAIGSPGSNTARVSVSDGWTSATGSVPANGTNSRPAVSVSGGGSCHPNCSVTFTGSATDADGDPVTLSWSGCATGTSGSVTCAVAALGSVSATLSAADGWDTGSAAGSGQGVNQPPSGSCASAFGSGGNNSGTVTQNGCTVTHALNEGVVYTISRSDPDGDALGATTWSTSDTLQCGSRTDTSIHCNVWPGSGNGTIVAEFSDGWGATSRVTWTVTP